MSGRYATALGCTDKRAPILPGQERHFEEGGKKNERTPRAVKHLFTQCVEQVRCFIDLSDTNLAAHAAGKQE